MNVMDCEEIVSVIVVIVLTRVEVDAALGAGHRGVRHHAGQRAVTRVPRGGGGAAGGEGRQDGGEGRQALATLLVGLQLSVFRRETQSTSSVAAVTETANENGVIL